MVTKTKLNVWYAIKYASLNSTWTTSLDGVPKTSVSQAQANVRITWEAWETPQCEEASRPARARSHRERESRLRLHVLPVRDRLGCRISFQKERETPVR